MRKPSTWATVKLRLRNSAGGTSGPGARRSTRVNQASATTATAAVPRIRGDVQAYVVPPQLPTRVSARMPVVSRATPAQSKGARTRSVRSRTPAPTASSANSPIGRLT